ncbi:hypothetical protein [Nitrosomonas sp.]|uniref:hypothetical protein n=1 Tax=Nitrosomonas sp. TaxID=42353 RepID=UPI0026239F81|nr:hypothetical protein [Nitrosomonas sp.]
MSSATFYTGLGQQAPHINDTSFYPAGILGQWNWQFDWSHEYVILDSAAIGEN